MRYDCRLPNNIKVCISKLFKSDDLNLNEFLKRGDENSLTILETYSADESKYKYNKILDNTKEYDKIYSKTYWIYYDDIKEFQKDYKNLVESINEWFSKNGLVDEVL